MTLKIVLLGWFLALGNLLGPVSAAQVTVDVTCEPLADDTVQSIRDYILQELLTNSQDAEVLVGQSVGTDNCYRRVVVTRESEVDVHAEAIVLFLSPDQRFLAGSLIDLGNPPRSRISFGNQSGASVAGPKSRETSPAGLSPEDSARSGPSDADVQVVMFSDYQCPFCARAHEIVKEARRRSTVSFSLLFRHLPLPYHDWAKPAAIAAECVRLENEGAFWELTDQLYSAQAQIVAADLQSRVRDFVSATFDPVASDRVMTCVSEERTREIVDRDLSFAMQQNLPGTPTLFIAGTRLERLSSTEQLLTMIQQAAAR